MVDWQKYRGCIIGEITITDQIQHDDIGVKACHSPWFFGTFGFVVMDGVLYDKPIPTKGHLGFWEVKLP